MDSPVDLTNDIARERDLELDIDGFDQAMVEQREKSRQGSSFAAEGQVRFDLEGSTEFLVIRISRCQCCRCCVGERWPTSGITCSR